jgi:hypothetical protein
MQPSNFGVLCGLERPQELTSFMGQAFSISSADRLTMRLVHAVKSGQKVTFLLGSGLTCLSREAGGRGVPGAAEMVERARELFVAREELLDLDEVLSKAQDSRRYQAAMQFVIECRGQTALNKLVRDAVLNARQVSSFQGSTDEELERDLGGWALPPAVEALGKLIYDHEKVFHRPILTSNFDPLIEVAIRRAGRGAISVNLPNDGSFRGLLVNDNSVQVVHFHGFWREGDTLHTPDQLTRERPLLTGNLRKLLQETVLVVMGYGGWDDVFTASLMKAIAEQSEVIDVLWCFFPKDHQEICIRYSSLLESFKMLPGQRVVAYAGVTSSYHCCNDSFREFPAPVPFRRLRAAH